MISTDSKDFIGSIARGMKVITAFDAEDIEMSPADVAVKTGLTRATARRILLTLTALGYVASDGKWFRLSPKILDLGFAYLTSMQIGQVMQPIINAASKKVGETCAISVMEGQDIISIAHSSFDRFDQVTFYPGTHMPACVSAAGRVILAHQKQESLDTYFRNVRMKRYTPNTITSSMDLIRELEKIRQQGYARVDGELEVGLYTVAAPIFNDDKFPIAAVTFGGNVARMNDQNIDNYLPELFNLAQRISRVLPNKHSIL